MNEGPPTAAGRRRVRLAASEVRDRMFAAAKDIIRAQGVTISLEEISMDDIVRRAGVARSSVYRLWPYKDEFVNALLLDLAGPHWLTTSGTDTDALLLVTDVVLEHWELLDNRDGRRAVLRETVRQAVDRNMRDMAQSVEWEVYTALVATARGNANDATRQHLAAELGRAEAAFIEQMTTFYASIGEMLGLRPRDPGLSFRHLAIALGATVQGFAMRQTLVGSKPSDERPSSSEARSSDAIDVVPGPGLEPGSQVEWSLAALAFLGVFDAIIELDPDWSPSDTRRRAVEDLRRDLGGAHR